MNDLVKLVEIAFYKTNIEMLLQVKELLNILFDTGITNEEIIEIRLNINKYNYEEIISLYRRLRK